MRAALLDIGNQYMKAYNIIVNNVTIKHLGKIALPSIIIQYKYFHVNNLTVRPKGKIQGKSIINRYINISSNSPAKPAGGPSL